MIRIESGPGGSQKTVGYYGSNPEKVPRVGGLVYRTVTTLEAISGWILSKILTGLCTFTWI